MSKIICDICGTKYPDNADQCPICGYSNTAAAEAAPAEAQEAMAEESVQETSAKKSGLFRRGEKPKTRRHNPEAFEADEPDSGEEEAVDEAVPAVEEPVAETAVEETPQASAADEIDDIAALLAMAGEDDFSGISGDGEDDDDDDEEDDDDEDDDDDDEDDEEEGSRFGSILLSVLLILVTVALLCVSGFILVKFILPGIKGGSEVIPTETQITAEAPTETEEPTVPCAELVLGETAVELGEIGQMYLLNVDVQPADTTDDLIFTSSDENVAIVNEEGRVTATGEGEAVITISCGEKSIEVNVSVVLPTEAPTEEATEEPTEEPTEETAEGTEAPTEEPTEEPTQAPTEAQGRKAIVQISGLKVRSGAGTEYGAVDKYNKGDEILIFEVKQDAKGQDWGRTDKGWVCLSVNGDEYVKFI